MKHIFFVSALLLISVLSQSQWTSGTGLIYYGGNVGIGTTNPLQALQIGDLTANSTSTPKAIDLGGTFSPTPGANLKLRLYNDGTSIGGLGISHSAMDYRVWNSFASHVFYQETTELMRITGSGNVGIGTANPLQALQIGDLTANATATPKAIDLGGTFSNTAATNLKLRLYNDGTNIGGLGISTSQLDYRVWNTAASHVFYQGSTELLRIKGDGNVGIGTNNPSQKLEVNGKMAVNYGILMNGVPNSGADINLIQNDNSSSTIGLMAGNGNFESSSGPYLGGRGNTYTALPDQRGLLFLSAGAVNSPIGKEGSIVFHTTSAAGAAELERMIIKRDGNIGIATADPSEKLDVNGNVKTSGYVLVGATTLPAADAKLAVNGNIYSKKVKVTPNGWADYVFDAGYRLRPLSEIEQYIQQHNHLPEVPTAAEVAKDGLDLGDNQATLLKKIEELTLYVIEQNKKNEEQNIKLQQMTQKMEQQQRELEVLKKKVNNHSNKE